MTSPEITVYTDGACSGNPGPGGWAWAVPDGPFCSGADAATTNQRMELQAVLDAVLHFEGALQVVSDSTYVVNCFRDRWWEGWLRKGWVNSQKKPVANRDIWEPLIDAYRADQGRLRFRWVKGHAGDVMNDLVDRLAVEAAKTQAGRRGEGTPSALGPADAPGSAGSPGSVVGGTPTEVGRADPRAPEGHRVVVGGLRPPGLGGYGETFAAAEVRDKLRAILAAKAQLHPDLVVLSGMGLGSEQLAVEAAAAAGVPYVAVLAFPDQESTWPAPTRVHFADLLAAAAAKVLLQSRPPTGRQAAGAALARRDAWLVGNAVEAIVVWDHDDSNVGRMVRSLQDRLGEAEVWVVEP